MAETGFMIWHNPDTTLDLICLCCFQTIGHAQSRADLLAAEDLHVCDSLEDFVTPQPDPLQGLYG
jgi:hypothetical protein